MSCNCRHLEKLKSARVELDEASAVYMDYNAACPPDHRVLAEFQNRALGIWGNSSSPHLSGQKAQDLLDSCIRRWQELSGKESIIFCRGATEAMDILLKGMAEPPGLLAAPVSAHPGIRNLMEEYSRLRKVPLKLLKIDKEGKIDLPALSEALDTPGALLCYSPVNHETGALQDCRRIDEICRERGTRIFLDAPQAAARLPETEWAGLCDGFSLSGQKIYGLKGSGVLAVNPPLALKSSPPAYAGTADTAGAAALTLAAELYRKEKDELLSRLTVLQREGADILEKGNFAYRILTPPNSAPGVLCICLPDMSELRKKGITMEELFYNLNRDGIFLSRFSACSGTVNGSSSILDAMGYPEEYTSSSLRISLGRKSRRDDFFRLRKSLDRFFSALPVTAAENPVQK